MGRVPDESAPGRVDQYALAVTAYELLSGRVPFDGPTPAAVVLRQRAAPPALEELLPSLPKGIDAALRQALNRDPGRRFPDCTTFARAVLQPLGETPRRRPNGPSAGTVSTKGPSPSWFPRAG